MILILIYSLIICVTRIDWLLNSFCDVAAAIGKVKGWKEFSLCHKYSVLV